MNQDNADLANECQACRGSESDLSADLTRKISAALSGWSASGPVPSGIHKSNRSSLILVLSTLYHCKNKNVIVSFVLIFIAVSSSQNYNNEFNDELLKIMNLPWQDFFAQFCTNKVLFYFSK